MHAESLKALLSGGIAFATPPRAGHTVVPGSVFRLHPEGKDQWRKWTADLSGQPQEKERGRISRFFHHEGKSEEQAREDDPSPEPTHDEKKHGFLHGLFH